MQKTHRVVAALGGNALKNPKQKGTFEETLENAHTAARQLVMLQNELNISLVVTHGNGPQVGAIFLQNEMAQSQVPPMPLFVCGAESQGLLGLILQTALESELQKAGIVSRPVVTVVTRVRVDSSDKAFSNPTKPIGSFMTKEEAEQVHKQQGKPVVEDAGRGWRVVVPSPDPVEIVEAEAIRSLLSSGIVVIACGGGGIPVIRDAETKALNGVDAVIDKDLAGERLANIVKADMFLILTDVEAAFINYKTPQQEMLRDVPIDRMRELLREGHFAKGSMGPKIESACRFVEHHPDGVAIITSLDKAKDAVLGKCGTRVMAAKKE